MAGRAVLTAIYDLTVSPVSFDFVSFLLEAESQRLKRGHEHMRVLIVPPEGGHFRRDRLAPFEPGTAKPSHDLRRRMCTTICEPMPALLPSCVESARLVTRDLLQKYDLRGAWPPGPEPAYGQQYNAKAYRENNYPFRHPSRQKREKKLVTLTLREAAHWPQRNSDRNAWLALYRALKKAGYKPVFIPDVDTPFAEPGCDVDHRASLDLLHRAALYERAHLNVFVNNGPAWMATAQREARVLIFKIIAEGGTCTGSEFWEAIGCAPGVYQVGREGHRIVWEDDAPEVLVRETFAELDNLKGL